MMCFCRDISLDVIDVIFRATSLRYDDPSVGEHDDSVCIDDVSVFDDDVGFCNAMTSESYRHDVGFVLITSEVVSR